MWFHFFRLVFTHSFLQTCYYDCDYFFYTLICIISRHSCQLRLVGTSWNAFAKFHCHCQITKKEKQTHVIHFYESKFNYSNFHTWVIWQRITKMVCFVDTKTARNCLYTFDSRMFMNCDLLGLLCFASSHISVFPFSCSFSATHSS